MIDPFRLDGKTALVTGGSGNLGRGITRSLAEAGASVAVSSSKNLKEIGHFLQNLTDDGFQVKGYQADLTEEKEAAALIESVLHDFGSLNILVNNAGIFSVSPLRQLEVSDWDEVFSLNMRGLFLCCREAVRHLEKSNGSIINIASINGVHPGFGNTAHYDASKGGVIAYTRSLAAELGPSGIRVNAVAPGLIDSAGLRGNAPELVEMYEEKAPLKHLVGREDIGRAAVYLASAAASAVTGTTVAVDCGYLLS